MTSMNLMNSPDVVCRHARGGMWEKDLTPFPDDSGGLIRCRLAVGPTTARTRKAQEPILRMSRFTSVFRLRFQPSGQALRRMDLANLKRGGGSRTRLAPLPRVIRPLCLSLNVFRGVDHRPSVWPHSGRDSRSRQAPPRGGGISERTLFRSARVSLRSHRGASFGPASRPGCDT